MKIIAILLLSASVSLATTTNTIKQSKSFLGLSQPKMSLPDGTMAPVRKAITTKAAPIRGNPYSINLNFVATTNEPGILVGTNFIISQWRLTNSGPYTGSNMIIVKMLWQSPIKPVRVATKSANLVILPMGPVQGIGWSPWDAGVNIALIDSTNMVEGRTYYQQYSIDGKLWMNTGNQMLWTSTDPTAYWRCIRAVPSDGPFNEIYRIYSP